VNAMHDSASFARRLSGLFDRQRFSQNPALCTLIAETESRCFGGRALGEDDLALVNAAGESDPLWDTSIRDETMRIIPVELGQGKNINQIVIADGPPDRGRNDS